MKLNAKALALRVFMSLLAGRESHILSTRATSEWIAGMQNSYLCLAADRTMLWTQ